MEGGKEGRRMIKMKKGVEEERKVKKEEERKVKKEEERECRWKEGKREEG